MTDEQIASLAAPGRIEYDDSTGFTVYVPICQLGVCRWRGKPIKVHRSAGEDVIRATNQAKDALRTHWYQFHRSKVDPEAWL